MLLNLLEVMAFILLGIIAALLLYSLVLVVIAVLRNLIKEAKGGGNNGRDREP